MKQVYGAFVAPLEREREPLENLTELQKGVMSCADGHLQTQILKVDEKSDPDMTKSRGYVGDEARAAPKCWMDVEKFSEVDGASTPPFLPLPHAPPSYTKHI